MKRTARQKDPLPLGLSPAQGDEWFKQQFPNRPLVGIDEAGRGPLAGPVVAAVVVLGDMQGLEGLNDSKKLTEAKRDALYPLICERAQCYAIAEASAEEIDAINILQADFLAMRRALQAIGISCALQDHFLSESKDVLSPRVISRGQLELRSATPLLLVDGNLPIHGVDLSWQMPLVKGDGRTASIAAASILAKVHRDRRMAEIARHFQGYGFEGHKGYPTTDHLDAIRRIGYSPAHRRSFKPKALEDLVQGDLFR